MQMLTSYRTCGRNRRGFATGIVLTVLFLVTLIASSLYLRIRRMTNDVAREQQDIQSRFLADSALDFVTELGRRGVQEGGTAVEMPGGQIGYSLGREKVDEFGRRFRPGVAFGVSGRFRKVVAFHMVYAERRPNRATLSRVQLEALTDISHIDLAPYPTTANGGWAVFLKRAQAALRQVPT
jgi:hypothetical protein